MGEVRNRDLTFATSSRSWSGFCLLCGSLFSDIKNRRIELFVEPFGLWCGNQPREIALRILQIAENHRFGGAGLDAGGLHARDDSVMAEVALFHCSPCVSLIGLLLVRRQIIQEVALLPLVYQEDTKRAGGEAGFRPLTNA